MRHAIIVCLAACAATPSLAQQFPYLDDRSSPSALVRSLYNAVNRKEYSRAWSYFSQAPAESADAYAKGYENTDAVDVIVGAAREEGAAGSIYYELPVAIMAIGLDGSNEVFSGCYTLRMADPSVGETFEPLHIERGSLKPFDGELEAALPSECDGRPMPERDIALERANALYADLAECRAAQMPFLEPEELAPEIHSISFRYEFDDPDQPERTFRVFRFLCSTGAYNMSHVYFVANDEDEVSPLHFAAPTLDIRYVGDRDEEVESMTIIGFNAESMLVNSTYDPEKRMIESHSNWRGIGDASSSGRWMFRNGQFDLIHYEVDASYDGEINGEVVLDYDTAP